MKRQNIVMIAAVIAACGVIGWKACGHRSTSRTTTAASSTTTTKGSGSAAVVVGRTLLDPKTIARASIAGTITDENKAPIAHASVCAAGYARDVAPELLREPVCSETDDKGQYTIGNLMPAKYTVDASAKTFRPGVYHPDGDRHQTALKVATGEHKTGIDIALRGGGVEITGIVSDLTGGPIAHARVRAGGGWRSGGEGQTRSECDEQGKFSLWVSPGDVEVTASADGYADSSEYGHAPGKLEILLTPESSLSGTVVDGVTGQPVAGVFVSVATSSEWGWDDDRDSVVTDDQGKFRATRLTPGRYVSVAKTASGYGRTEGSTLVGLGQNVDGVVVKLWKAFRIEGKVILSTTKAPCEHPSLSLTDKTKGRWLETESLDGGVVVAEAVRPGTYSVSAGCRGYQSRDKYEAITITDKDVTGLVWEVDPGATIRGKVLAKSGEPLESVAVWASTVGGDARAREDWNSDRSTRDGSYELTGLKAATYKLDTNSERGVGPKDGFRVEVTAGAVIQKDLVLDDGGTIKGTIVDSEGKPVSGADINAQATGAMMWSFGGGDHKSDETGAFQIDSLRPGDYRVTAERNGEDLRKPGTTDDAKQGEKTTVRANQTAVVKLVVETQSGTIKGTVVDTEGKPVPDAFVSAARESDAAGAQRTSVEQTRWGWNEKPMLTTVDGTFTLSKLSAGNYTVRAYRKGGGEAVQEHVAIGSTTKLQIKATGSIEGTARRAGSGPTPEDMTLNLRDATTGFSRREQFYKSGGHFVVNDIPKGHFTLTVEADGSQKQMELDLGDGEAKTGLVVELEAMVTITGRLVELGTQKPISAMQMMASPASGGGRMIFRSGGDDDNENITDTSGHFTIKNVPTGKLSIRGFPKNFGDDDNEYGFISAVRTVSGTGTVDIGDIGAIKRRIKKGDPAGDIGVHFVQQPPDTQPDQREYKVSWIDPAGPAAKVDIKVGDIVTSVDTIDVTGANSSYAWTLMSAPPGTKLTLGLARKVTVEIVLAAP